MAPTIKWQRWDAANYDWLGTSATDALPSLEAELDAWFASVNANPSNTNRQLTKLRGYASSTGGNYAALTISAQAEGTADIGYYQWGALGSASGAKAFYMGDTFVDDASRGGYGTVSNGPSDSGISSYVSGVEGNWLIAYDTVDGQEFFATGPTYDSRSSTREDGFAIIKLESGEWLFVGSDGGTKHAMTCLPAYGWVTPSYNKTTSFLATNVLGWSDAWLARFNIPPQSSSTSPSVMSDELVWVAANPNLFSFGAPSAVSSCGDRAIITDLGDGTNVYLVTVGAYGPRVLMDLR